MQGVPIKMHEVICFLFFLKETLKISLIMLKRKKGDDIDDYALYKR